MGKVGVLVAMMKERSALFPYGLPNKTLSGDDVICRVSGIGKANAAVTAYRMCMEDEVDRVLCIGCACAVDPSLSIGDVLVASRCVYHDVWCGKPNQRGQVQGEPAFYQPDFFKWSDAINSCLIGGVATGDCFIEDMLAAGSISTWYNVRAADMESAAVAQTCFKTGKDFSSIRVISDSPYKQVQTYEMFWVKAKEYFKPIRDLFLWEE